MQYNYWKCVCFIGIFDFIRAIVHVQYMGLNDMRAPLGLRWCVLIRMLNLVLFSNLSEIAIHVTPSLVSIVTKGPN